ncbi:MAG: sodium:solute symporter family protein [Candidatus Kapabacteria bacterium]|nr:sodium:solute symporter family protein [Candidatus Kapabacteria bacterium]MDW7996526.1 sodium:solute symporter family protein [Bacteroidota bacterium]MDW8225789.1 sodium:solute symporter family protein [Bacteroidota bacterium]
MKLATGDWLVVLAYVLAILVVGFGIAPRWRGEHRGEAEEYLLAGRQLTLPLFVATLVATWYGAILGVGEFVYRYGIVAWLCIGVPYYLVAAAFAIVLAGRIRSSQTLTIPQQMRLFYGESAGRVAALLVLLITIPSAYLLMLATLVRALTGWSLEIAIVVGAVLSVAYLYTGGFKADVLTNAVQFLLMYAGFFVLAWFSVQHLGDPVQMWKTLPQTHRSVPGALGWMAVVVWFVIAMQTFVDPSFYQRCAAARSVRTARMGIAVSVLFWLLFDTLSITTALYARAFIQTEPLGAYPALAEVVLPEGWKGLFVVALFATVMSTLESYAFLSAATIGHDLLGYFPRLAGRYSVRQLTRLGLILAVSVAGLMAWVLPSVVELIMRTASVAVPALLFPFLFGYAVHRRLPARRVGLLMAVTAASSALWMGIRMTQSALGIVQAIEPAFVGIVVGMCISLLWSKPRYAAAGMDSL